MTLPKMQLCTSSELGVKIIDLSEQFALFEHMTGLNYPGGRIAPALEIWALAFAQIFRGDKKPQFSPGISEHSVDIATARIFLKSSIVKEVGSRNLVRGTLTGQMAVIWYWGPEE